MSSTFSSLKKNIPASLTSTSGMIPSPTHHSCRSSAARGCARSWKRVRTLTGSSDPMPDAATCRSSSLLLTSIRSYPRAPSPRANSRPIPELPPVISATIVSRLYLSPFSAKREVRLRSDCISFPACTYGRCNNWNACTRFSRLHRFAAC